MKAITTRTLLLGIGIIIGITVTIIAWNGTSNPTTADSKKEQLKPNNNAEKYNYSFHVFQW